MVAFDVVTHLVRAFCARCKVGVPFVQGLGEMKQNVCSSGHAEAKATRTNCNMNLHNK